MRNTFFILFLLLASQAVYAQNISGYIQDQTTKEPIPNALIFIDGSLLSTLSNVEGYFDIDLKNNQSVNLVITHLAYDNEVIFIKEDVTTLGTIYLKESLHELNDITVSQKSNKRLRKRRLKQFLNAFMGSEKNRLDIELLNPEAVLFYEENDILFAIANEPLKIQNSYLGYMIQFFLTDFKLHPNDDVIYKGTSSFKEIESSENQQAKVKRNRRKAFGEIHRSFFYELIYDKFALEKYAIGISQKNYQNEFEQFQALPLDSLHLNQNQEGNFELAFEHHLTVKNIELAAQREAAKSAYQKSLASGIKQTEERSTDDLISYLGSKSNKIVLDKNGRIINPLEIEEYGYWATKRIAHLLPMDYRIN